MVFAARPPRGGAGVTPAPDPTRTTLIAGPGGCPSCLAPNEHLVGDGAERAILTERLAAQRATAGLDRAHPGVIFSLLPWVLADLPESSKAAEIFYAGASLLAARYERLGLHRLLPTDRVWVGVRSPHPGTFGGFHHPDQGYRHWQMGAVITRYGRLDRPVASPELVALDLLRAYAHDCLHYGSYREYQLWGGELVRTGYGINRRSVDGRTYSAPDPAGSPSTRNLGIVMEGATDREATTLTRRAAERAGVAEPGGMDRFAFRDVTGRLTDDDLPSLPPRQARAGASGSTARDFLSSMGSYTRGVNNRYSAFLSEVGGPEADDLHTVIVESMISGSLAGLSAWLDRRYGSGAFATLFRSASYGGPDLDLGT